MQTVINNYNIINGNVIGSAILQGVSDSAVSMSNMIGLGEFECEILRIFLSLDIRRKAAALAYLYDLEDGKALPDVTGVSIWERKRT